MSTVAVITETLRFSSWKSNASPNRTAATIAAMDTHLSTKSPDTLSVTGDTRGCPR